MPATAAAAAQPTSLRVGRRTSYRYLRFGRGWNSMGYLLASPALLMRPTSGSFCFSSSDVTRLCASTIESCTGQQYMRA